MRISWTLVVGLASLPFAPAEAADTDGTLLVQNQAPAPQPQPPAQPFQIEPQPRPRQPLFPVPPFPLLPRTGPTATARCTTYTMRLLPADPRIDPKFIIPHRDTGTKYTMREVTPPPQPQCR